MGNIQKLNNSFYYVATIVTILLVQACNSKKIMTQDDWENDSYQEQTFLTENEVDEIIENVVNSEHKDKPYQAPADKDWQLVHSDIKVEVDFNTKTLLGEATLTLKPYFYPQQTLTLDAKGMDIFHVGIAAQNGKIESSSDWKNKNSDRQNSSGVETEGPKPETLSWRYEDSLHLVIDMPYIIAAGEELSLTISYQAFPERRLSQSKDLSFTAVSDDKGVYFVNADASNPNYAPQVWTQGEPESNSRWFPTLDNPIQKHTQKVRLVYPDTMISVSNGYRRSSEKLNNGKKLDVWEMTEPHAVYLTMFAIGNWSVIRDSVSIGKGAQAKVIPMRYLVEPAYDKYAKTIFGNTGEMIQFFSDYTGVPYPWNKYDQIVCREFVSGAMENTTAVVHNERLQDPTYEMEDYISHELFHHWFGDYTTCESWSHLSMNESFARYSEYLWREYKYGPTNAHDWLFDNVTYPYMDESGEAMEGLETSPLINPHFHHANDQFDDIRYNKGAQILHELRHFIGDKAFRLSMNRYLTQYAYQNANAYDWKRCIEKVTGKNMDHFFNSWYFQGGEYANLYHIQRDSSTGNRSLIVEPKLAENRYSAAFLKKYGRTKFQQVYVHLLGTNSNIWDTTLLVLPNTQKITITLPFTDSICLLRYTNPQNYNYSFQEREAYSALTTAKRIYYVLNQKDIPYMDKIEFIRDKQRIDGQEKNSQVADWWLKNMLIALDIDKNSPLNKPLLSKICFEEFSEIMEEILAENEFTFTQGGEKLIRSLKAAYESGSLTQKVFYLSFLHRLNEWFPDAQATSKLDIEALAKSNEVSALEAYFMHAFFSKTDQTLALKTILNAPENTSVAKAKICAKIFEMEFEESVFKNMIGQIAKETWPIDQISYWLERSIGATDRSSIQLLDEWIQQIKNDPLKIRSSKYVFQSQWEELKKQQLASEWESPQSQYLYSVLETLYSINLK